MFAFHPRNDVSLSKRSIGRSQAIWSFRTCRLIKCFVRDLSSDLISTWLALQQRSMNAHAPIEWINDKIVSDHQQSTSVVCFACKIIRCFVLLSSRAAALFRQMRHSELPANVFDFTSAVCVMWACYSRKSMWNELMWYARKGSPECTTNDSRHNRQLNKRNSEAKTTRATTKLRLL